MEGNSARSCSQIFAGGNAMGNLWGGGKEHFQPHTEDQQQEFLTIPRVVLRGNQTLPKIQISSPDVQDQSLGSNRPLCPLAFGIELWQKRNFLGHGDK